jgi:hypothetical protein
MENSKSAGQRTQQDMKTDQKSTPTVCPPSQMELFRRILENLVLVKNCGTRVVVRLTRDNFAVPAKTLFIRHLALAGFIPDRYQGYSESSDCAALSVQWVIDTGRQGDCRPVV